MALSILTASLLLTACATKPSELEVRRIVVAPELVVYGASVQDRALEEFEALGPPCPKVEATPGCSAIKTMIMDYKRTRDQIRALTE